MTQLATHPLDQPRTPPPPPTRAVPDTPVLTLAGVLTLAHLPLLWRHGEHLWAREHYQHFGLIVAGVVLLAVPAYRLARESGPTPKARAAARVLLGLNFAMLVFAALMNSPLLGTVAFWVLLMATALAAGGTPCLKAAWKALFFYLLLIPPPFGLDETVIQGLQSLTSKSASRILDLIPVYHSLNGVIVESAGKKFEVERACSGISSLLSIIACTLFYVLYFNAHWLRATLLLAAAIFWVLVNNITRVFLIVFFYSRYEWDLTDDSWPWKVHTLLGLGLFIITLVLLWSTDCLLRFFGSAISWGDREKRRKIVPAAEPQPHWAPGWNVVAPAVFAYGALFAFESVEWLMALPSASMTELKDYYNTFTADTLPDDIEGWKQIQKDKFFDEGRHRNDPNPLLPQGAYSRTWLYQGRGRRILLSFDYPFPTWHDLRVCYSMTGWQMQPMEGKDDFQIPLKGASSDLDCVRVSMTKPAELRHGYLWFGEFDPNGNPVPKEYVSYGRGALIGERLAEVRDRWLSLVGARPRPQPKRFEILQVQALTEGYGQMTDAELAECEKFFASGVALVREKVVAGLKK